jgi:heme A synthase
VSVAFRRLALTGVVATFLLILVGGIVRVSDSGLGCGPAGSGLHGWPLCAGRLLPSVDANAVIEYSHRALASAVGLLMLLIAVVALWRLRGHRGIVRASLAAAALVVAQGLLGAATVELNLHALLVAAHLALAMLLLALVLYLWRATRPAGSEASRVSGGRGLRALGTAGSICALLTIVAGGYMAGTEHNGRPDEAATTGAHYACGTQFPACNGGFLPFGQAPLVDVHLTHRVLVYLTAALVVVLALLVLRRRPTRAAASLAAAALVLLALQVLVGALNVWIAPTEPWLVVLHLGLGTLLFASLVDLRLALSSVPAAAPASRAAPTSPDAVAASVAR